MVNSSHTLKGVSFLHHIFINANQQRRPWKFPRSFALSCLFGSENSLERKQSKGHKIDVQHARAFNTTVEPCCKRTNGNCQKTGEDWVLTYPITRQTGMGENPFPFLPSKLGQDVVGFPAIVPLLAISEVELLVDDEEVSIAPMSPFTVSIEQLVVRD